MLYFTLLIVLRRQSDESLLEILCLTCCCGLRETPLLQPVLPYQDCQQN